MPITKLVNLNKNLTSNKLYILIEKSYTKAGSIDCDCNLTKINNKILGGFVDTYEDCNKLLTHIKDFISNDRYNNTLDELFDTTQSVEELIDTLSNILEGFIFKSESVRTIKTPVNVFVLKEEAERYIEECNEEMSPFTEIIEITPIPNTTLSKIINQLM